MIQSLYAKIALTLLVTVLVPLGFSVYLVTKAIDTTLSLGLNKDIAAQLEHGLLSSRRYIEEVKRGSKSSFEHIVDSHGLMVAAEAGDLGAIWTQLNIFLEADHALESIRLSGPGVEDIVVAPVDRGARDSRRVTLDRDVALGAYTRVEAVFGIDAGALEAFERAGEEIETYRALVDAPPAYLEQRVVGVYLGALGIAFLASILVGMFWARAQVRRIRRLGDATAKVAAGDLNVRVDPGHLDEVGALVRSFNSMVAELQDSRTRIEYLQKIGAWQEIARRLAHEIKNPLTPIQLAAQQLRQKHKDSDPGFDRLLEQSTEIIEEEVATLRRLTSEFSSFAKLPEVSPLAVTIGSFMQECESSLGSMAEAEGVELQFQVHDADQEVMLDRMLFKRVIDNLVRNAIEALRSHPTDSPRIQVRSECVTSNEDEEEVIFSVYDNGPGISKADLAVLFDPYYTTKEEGTGLGLAICKKIVFEHGGHITVENAAAGGAVFYIALPLPETEIKKKRWTWM